MKRLLIILSLLVFASCDRTFEQRTAKYTEVGPVCENRAAVLDMVDGQPRWGYVDGEGRLVVACTYLAAGDFSEGRAAVKIQGGMWGYIDPEGKMLIAPRYTSAKPFAEGRAWVQAGGAYWGCIDLAGQNVIDCLYTDVGQPDARGWMAARRDGKYGFLLASGEEVVPCVYDRIDAPDRYGLIPVESGGKHGFLGSDGREVLPCFFAYISDFSDGYARTNYGGTVAKEGAEPYGGLWGLADSLGREAIPCRYYWLGAPSEGLAAFRTDAHGHYGYVDVKGYVSIKPRFAVARAFEEGVAVVSYNNENFGIVDRNGNELSSFRYKRLGSFRDGLAPFNLNPGGAVFQNMDPRCGYIDAEGREALPAKWDGAAGFSEMRAAVMRYGLDPEDFFDARWGYITRNGKLVVPLKYHEAHPFSCGLARVYIRGLGYGYIDRDGNEVVPCKYDEAEDFHDFTACVKQYGRTLRIDDKGNLVDEKGNLISE